MYIKICYIMKLLNLLWFSEKTNTHVSDSYGYAYQNEFEQPF